MWEIPRSQSRFESCESVLDNWIIKRMVSFDLQFLRIQRIQSGQLEWLLLGLWEHVAYQKYFSGGGDITKET